MRFLIQLSLIITAIATALQMAQAADTKHSLTTYHVRRYNNTTYIADYTCLGPPWFELSKERTHHSCCRTPDAPRIVMLRLDDTNGWYREVIWIDEVWTVDEIKLRSK